MKKDKLCKICNKTKPIEEFPKWRGKCKKCYTAYCLEKYYECSAKNPEKYRRTRKEYYIRKIASGGFKEYKKRDLKRYIWQAAKTRAKKYGIEFSIEKSDIIIPEYCPVLGIKLQLNDLRAQDSSYSLDRKDNSKGYIKGNIIVISWKANRIKNDSNIEDLEKVLLWMKSINI